MGCWYETCGLSGLPIVPHDPVGLFLLVPGASFREAREPGGFCYPDGQWRPVCPPIFGTYNDDWGTIHREKPPAHWALTEELLRSVNVETSFTDEFFHRIERGKVIGRGFQYGYQRPNNEFPVGQMLVRRDIWDFLLQMQLYGGDPTAYQQCRKDARKLVNYAIENPPASEREGLEWAFQTDRHFEAEGGPFFQAVFGPQPFAFFYKTKLLHALVTKTISSKKALAVFDEIADHAYIHAVMHPLRRAYRPQPGKGSQDTDWDIHEKLALQVAEVAKRKQRDEE